MGMENKKYSKYNDNENDENSMSNIMVNDCGNTAVQTCDIIHKEAQYHQPQPNMFLSPLKVHST